MNRENREFIALFNASGWNEAEAARRLYTTRQTVNRYLIGEMKPKPSVIELFKLVLAGVNPDALAAAVKAGGPELQKFSANTVYEKLNEIRANDPKAYEILKQQVDFVHDRMAKPPPNKVLIQKAHESVKTNPTVTYGKRRRITPGSGKPASSEKTPEDRIVEAVEDELKKPDDPAAGSR